MFQKFNQIKSPSPAGAIVYVDESQNSVDDGNFALSATKWINSPTMRHSRGCVFSFADGHVEHWRWLGINQEMPRGVTPSTPAQVNDLNRLYACEVLTDSD